MQNSSSTVDLTLATPPPTVLPQELMSSSPPTRSIPTPTELLQALKRRWLLASFLGLSVGAAAVIAAWLALPDGKHQVRTLVQIQPHQSVVRRGASDDGYDAFKDNQSILLRTRSLLTRVTGKPKVSQLPMIQESADPEKLLEDRIQLRWESPEILAVMINGDDPEQMKVILDTLMLEYLEDTKSAEMMEREGQLKRLEQTKTELAQQIAGHEDNLRRLAQWSGVGESDLVTAIQNQAYSEGLSRAITEDGQLGRTIQNKELKKAELENRLGRADELPVDAEQVRLLAEQNPKVQEATLRVEAAREAMQKLSAQVTKEHPLYARAADDVKAAEADVQAALRQAQPELETAVRAAHREALREDLALVTEELKELGRAKATMKDEIRNLEDRIATVKKASLGSKLENDERKPLRDQLDVVNMELLNLRMSQKIEPRVKVREASVVILNQNLNRKLMMSGAAGMGGLLLTVFAVALLEWRVRRVASVDQVVAELGMRVIGTIPTFPSGAVLASTDGDQTWRFELAESVNAARTMLLHAAKAQSMQVIMVTSATQGEGKTSLSSQLATSMAAAGMRTLMLDCDLRNPSLHKLFDVPVSPGCSEVLLQEIDVSDAVHPTSEPNLWLIPAGNCSHRVISALAQGHPLDTLFNRLRGQFDFIIVDSCPVLPVADTLLVGQHVDGVIISVMQDVSQMPKVSNASEKLAVLSIPLLGAVVNGTTPNGHTYGYNYVKQLPA